jgi:hypothetical protein
VVVAVAVAAVEPASVLALAVVVAVAAEVGVAAVVVLALPSSGRPTHRTAERYRLPQAPQSIVCCLGWCPLRLLPKLHRS